MVLAISRCPLILLRNPSIMLNNNPVWFITGCSTGFGRELAQRVLARGWRAVMTARNPATLDELLVGHEDNALALKLDVDDNAQIIAAVKAAEARFGRIDVLVNNAGYGYLAAIEEGEDDAVRAMFETNVFGLINATKAVLPGMRARHHGMIINISSIGGITSFGATGYYHATKFAVEGLSGSLALECKPLGIDVMAVEPGPFRTNWAGASIKESATRIAAYDATAGVRREQTAARSGNQVGDPRRAADAIIEAALAKEPPRHLLLGEAAVKLARDQIAALRSDIDTWEATSLSADFPQNER
jgi:NAD(P)-dependent dehydrogenase (short-subunit alcohol dehydrogenase family)